MNCPRHEDVSAYIDAAMTPAERNSFARHLETCPACSDYLQALHALHGRFAELPSPVLGFDLAAQFEQSWQRPAVRRRPRWRLWADRGAGGLAIACSLAAGAWLGGLTIGGAVAVAPQIGITRVFSPVPPGGLCAAPELCDLPGGKQ
jgi:anti-sigma factor RsiW